MARKDKPDTMKPHNVEAEESLIGSLLIDSDKVIEVSRIIQDRSSFFIERNWWVYDAIKKLHDNHEPTDLVTLSDELERRGQLHELGGLGYLNSLMNNTPTSMHAEYYAKIVEKLAVLRRIIDASERIAKIGYNDNIDSVNDAIIQAKAVLDGVQGLRVSSGLQHYANALFDEVERIDYVLNNDTPTGIPTGLKDLDVALHGGLQWSDLIIVAGRPGMGKTSAAVSVGLNVAKADGTVAIFTMEMSTQQLSQRILAMESDLSVSAIRQVDLGDEEVMMLAKASNDLSRYGVYIDDTPAINIDYLRSECIKLKRESKLDLVIVDYIQLMTGVGENRQQEISYISRNLKSLAKELNVPFIALSQLSRQVESRQDKRPMLSDLRESGSIEQDADIVIFIYRDEVYNEDTEFPNMAELIISKHRSGATGKANVFFKKHSTLFCDLEIKRDSLDY